MIFADLGPLYSGSEFFLEAKSAKIRKFYRVYSEESTSI